MEFKTSSFCSIDIDKAIGTLISDCEGAGNCNDIICALNKSGQHDCESRYGLDSVSFSRAEIIKASTFEVQQRLRYLRYRYDFKYYPMNRKLREFPLVLAIEVASDCNMRCKMCFQSTSAFDSHVKRGRMDFELFKTVINQAVDGGVYSIVLASRGEPLLNEKLFEMIRYAKDAGILDIKLNTNALALTEENSRRLLASGVDMLVFSVDSLDPIIYKGIRNYDIEKIKRNIIAFSKIRRLEFSQSRITTRVAIVLADGYAEAQRGNVEHERLFWSSYVDEVSVKTQNDFQGIYNPQAWHGEKPACGLLWERLYIWYNGDINPCDIDFCSELKIGSISEMTIAQAWHSKKMATYRELHTKKCQSRLSPCVNCNGY